MRSLVLLHGFLGLPAAWEGLRRMLPPELPIVAPALSGHGGAPVVASFDEEVARLAGLVEASGLSRPHLVGYSLGGRLALGLLAARPELFSGATLVSARGALTSEAERVARRQDDERLAGRLEREGLAAFLERWDQQPLFASQGALLEDQRRAWRDLRLVHDPGAVTVGLRALSLGAMPDLSSALAGFAGPVTVLAGALDPKFLALAPGLAACFPCSTWASVPGAGHNLPLEAPAAIADALPRSLS